MDEYIKKNQALCCFSGWVDKHGDFHEPDEMIEYQRIEQLPAADVVPVVRCADCIRYRSNGEVWGHCTVSGIGRMRRKDYCSYGVRKDSDHETD